MVIQVFKQIDNNISQSTPSNPGGTTSLTQVMMGLAIPFTPKYSGKVKIIANAVMANTVGADTETASINYGTGTAPINGAAVTGTLATANLFYANGPIQPFIGLVTLTIGTTYWFDIALSAVTGGTASAQGITIILEEVQK